MAQAMRRLGSASNCAQLRARPTPSKCAVAAPQRPDAITAADSHAVHLSLNQHEKSQLEAMITGVGSLRPQQFDRPLSPPSTSGRSSAPTPYPTNRPETADGNGTSSLGEGRGEQDRPFVPGSRRRLGRRTTRRSLSELSFYGEYCDAQATQRMVSRIWRRLVAEPEVGDGAPAMPSAAATTLTAAALPLTSEAPVTMNAAATAGRQAGSSGAISAQAFAARSSIDASLRGEAPGPATTQGEDGGCSETSLANMAVEEPSNAGGSSLGIPGVSTYRSLPRHRVVLYLGPEFQLQLPPPLPSAELPPAFAGTWSTPLPDADAGGGSGSGGDGDGGPGLAWALSEEELLESLAARPPQTVRGTRLSSSEKWRTVGRRSGRVRVKGEATEVTATGRAGRAAATRRNCGDNVPTLEAAAAAAAAAAPAEAAPREAAAGRRSDQHGPRCEPQQRQRQQQQRQRQQRQRQQRQRQQQQQPPQQQPSGNRDLRQELQQQLEQGQDGALHVAQSGMSRVQERQLTLQRNLVNALMQRQDDVLVTELIKQLHAGNRMGITAINHVQQVLGNMGYVHSLSRLLTLQVALGLYNEHTYATVFRGMYRSGRLDMALGAFQEACRSGRDLGPVACSVLVHIASQERNLKLAWQLFDKMMEHKMTLNRYAYNCMAHIASMAGSMDDVLLVYNMMKAEAAGTGEAGGPPRPECGPDSYTYSALVRAAAAVGRGDLLPGMFNEMAAWQRARDRAVGRLRPLAPGEGEGRLSTEVWGHFIAAAFRSGQPDLALRFFDAGLTDLGLLPNAHIYNTVLAAMARARPLPQVFAVYRQMIEGHHRPLLSTIAAHPPVTEAPDLPPTSGAGLTPPGMQPALPPDHYTFNALLTAAAHHMSSLSILDRIRRDMSYFGVSMNTHVGTSFINAYRRTPELSRAVEAAAATATAGPAPGPVLTRDGAEAAVAAAAAAAHVVAEAEAVMTELVSSGAASATSYICMAALYVTARRPADVVRCLRAMLGRGLAADGSAWQFLVQTAEDTDMFAMLPTLHAAQERQRQLQAQAQAQASRHRMDQRRLGQQEQQQQQQEQW